MMIRLVQLFFSHSLAAEHSIASDSDDVISNSQVT